MSNPVSGRWPFVAGPGAPIVVVGEIDLREVIAAAGGEMIRIGRGREHLNVLADKLEGTPLPESLLQVILEALDEARPHTRIPGPIRGAM